MREKACNGLTAALICVALLFGASSCSGSGPGATDGRPNVLFIVVDTLRADHLGCYGYGRPTSPVIDALASEGVLFENAHSAAPWTMPSVATMLTGMYPTRHGVTDLFRVLSDELETLPEMAREMGYATGAVVSHYLIGSQLQYDQGFEHFSQDEAQGHYHLSTPGVTERAQALLEDFAQQPEPFLLFVHYFDPHFQYLEHPGVEYPSKAASSLTGREPFNLLQRRLDEIGAADVAFLEELYDEEIRFTDEGIGRLLETLSALGLEEDTLVVFTSDHGEEFMTHGWLGHARTLYQELVHVPLIVRGPGLRSGLRVAEPVSLVSLTPTLVALMQLDGRRAAFQARSLADLLRGEAGQQESAVFAEVDFTDPRGEGLREAHKRAIIEGRYKLIRDEVRGDLELYDLQADSDELQEISAAHPEIVQRMVEALEQHLQSLDADLAPSGLREIGDEELNELQKLGYVDGTDDEE